MSVNNSEILARYINSEGWFNGSQVMGNAFRPSTLNEKKALKVSVTRHDGTNETEIKKRVEAYKNTPRKNPVQVFGWADVSTGAVRTISTIPDLDLEEAPSKGDPFHAHIIGWDLDEGQRMLQAEDVARVSKLTLL